MRIIKPFNDWMYKDSFCEKDIQKRDLEGFETEKSLSIILMKLKRCLYLVIEKSFSQI